MNKVNVLDIRFSNISDEELLNVIKGAFKSDTESGNSYGGEQK